MALATVAKDEKIRQRVMGGSADANISFDELCSLVEAAGFKRHEKKKTSHRVFSKHGVIELINLQPIGNGKAKPYQVKQVRKLLQKYGL